VRAQTEFDDRLTALEIRYVSDWRSGEQAVQAAPRPMVVREDRQHEKLRNETQPHREQKPETPPHIAGDPPTETAGQPEPAIDDDTYFIDWTK
jgi:hypothetical protein